MHGPWSQIHSELYAVFELSGQNPNSKGVLKPPTHLPTQEVAAAAAAEVEAGLAGPCAADTQSLDREIPGKEAAAATVYTSY